MTTPTTNYGWGKPVNGASADTWGTELNAVIDAIDSQVKANFNTAAAATALCLVKASNLSDVANAGTARGNLGIGNIATRAITIQSGGSASGGADGDIFFIY